MNKHTHVYEKGCYLMIYNTIYIIRNKISLEKVLRDIVYIFLLKTAAAFFNQK